MQKVVVVGAGGFGREVIEIFKDDNKKNKKWEILGYVDDDPAKHGQIINGYPVLGGIEWLIDHNKDVGCVLAIGDTKAKKSVAESLEKNHVTFVNAIHPSVIMSDFVKLGKGVIICAGNILTVNITLGDHVLINLSCIVGHDAVIKDYCSIMPICSISGNVTLNEGVYLGTAATLIHQISVGAWTTIGAGAVVISNIPDNVVAIGVPAKVHKQ